MITKDFRNAHPIRMDGGVGLGFRAETDFKDLAREGGGSEFLELFDNVDA